MKSTIKNFQHNAIIFKFSNGNTIDAVFGRGSYSDNYDKSEWSEFANQSTTVEIMYDCSNKLEKSIEKKHGEQPLGRISINEWFDIANKIRKE